MYNKSLVSTGLGINLLAVDTGGGREDAPSPTAISDKTALTLTSVESDLLCLNY